jgi:hypothetical protein
VPAIAQAGEGVPAMSPPANIAAISAFSSEAGTGSHHENASKNKKTTAPLRFCRNGKNFRISAAADMASRWLGRERCKCRLFANGIDHRLAAEPKANKREFS